MRRTAVLAIAAAAVGLLPAAAQAGAIDLRIAYRATKAAAPRTQTLRCDPARGSVAHPAAACRRLRVIGDDAFAPTPPGMMACSQIYGGPMTAVVTGWYYGRKVWARLTRSDGCAVERWSRVAFLFPPAPAAQPGRAPGS